jgi:hypothetical protein
MNDMYKYLGASAGALMLAALALPSWAAAAEQRQDPGIHKQFSGTEFSSQRRRYVVRRHYRPRYYGYRSYPYYGGGYRYGYAAPYRYSPGPYVNFGPFGFGLGGW